MHVRVRLFASFAEIARWREKDVELPDGATAGDVLALLRKGPLLVLPRTAKPLLSVNRAHVPPDHPVHDGDEVAIFPPVSGGAPPAEPAPTLLITEDPLDPGLLTASVRHPACGAIVTFEGDVRDRNEGLDVEAVEYEAYADMAREMLQSIRDEVLARFPTARLAAAHRTGRLEVGEASVVVACAAPHRREAFAACRLAMDRIKEALPVWKREEGVSGDRRWAHH